MKGGKTSMNITGMIVYGLLLVATSAFATWWFVGGSAVVTMMLETGQLPYS
jgi:hypothetical protein